MIITKTVELEAEVNVYIDADDIAIALAESADSVKSYLRCLNNVSLFLRCIPGSMIEEMNETQRQLVRDFLREQAARYDESAPTDEA